MKSLLTLRSLVPALCAAVALSAIDPARAADWPQWRGPALDGSSEESGLPDALDPATTLVWEAALPGPGASTPVIEGGRVYLTCADAGTGDLLALAFDAATGAPLWRHRVGTDRKALGNNNMASPSAVADGGRVLFTFGTGDMAAFDRDGRALWSRSLEQDHGAFVIKYGYSSTPLLFDGRLYVIVLQNKLPDRYVPSTRTGPLDSFLLALDPATGRDLWKRARPTPAEDESTESYNSPMPMRAGSGHEIVIAGGECVTGHDLLDGAERWRWMFSPQDAQEHQRVIPSPVAGDGLLYVVRPKRRPLFALRPAGRGALGDGIVAWCFDGPSSDSATPLLYRGRLYVLEGDKRIFTCLDAKTGRTLWQENLGGSGRWRGSPTGADGKVYCLCENGDVAVVAAADTFRAVSRTSLGGAQTRASIAVARGRVYARTAERVCCFAKAGERSDKSDQSDAAPGVRQ